MHVPQFRYLRWFKERAPHARILLANSGMPHPPESLLPLKAHGWQLDIDDTGGYSPLVSRVAAHAGVPPDSVVITPGCTYAVHAAVRAMVAPGDAVAVEGPTYELLVRVAELCGAQIRRLPRPLDDGFAPRLDQLAELFDEGARAALLTVPHNPSGRLLDDMQVAELAALAASHEARILADEVYLDFHASPHRPYRSLASVSDRFVSTGSLTKVQGLANLRVGWVVGPPDVLEGVRRFHEFLADRIPAFDAQAAVLAFEAMDRLLERARLAREKNWPIVAEWAAGLSGAELLDPGAGITTILRIPGEIDALALAEGIFEREGVLVAPAEMFGAQGFLRISFGIEEQPLREGLKAVERALSRAVQRV